MKINDISDPVGDIGPEPQQFGEAGGGDAVWPGELAQPQTQPQQPDPSASQPDPALPRTQTSRRDIQRHVTKTPSCVTAPIN